MTQTHELLKWADSPSAVALSIHPFLDDYRGLFFTIRSFNPRYQGTQGYTWNQRNVLENPCLSTPSHNAVHAETGLREISSINNKSLKRNVNFTSQVVCYSACENRCIMFSVALEELRQVGGNTLTISALQTECKQFERHACLTGQDDTSWKCNTVSPL